MCSAEDELHEVQRQYNALEKRYDEDVRQGIDRFTHQVSELAADVDRGIITTAEFRTQTERLRVGKPVAMGALS